MESICGASLLLITFLKFLCDAVSYLFIVPGNVCKPRITMQQSLVLEK